MDICSQITFFYYEDLSPAIDFYERIMGLKLVDDQGTCRIYEVHGGSFLGIVDEKHGHCRAQRNEKNVLATFVVDDLEEWYSRLKKQGVKMTSDLLSKPEIQIKAFFFEDPNGYALEMQSFLNPSLKKIFGHKN